MDGENFYDEYKNALQYLGVSWGDKKLVTVVIKDGCIVMSYGHREISIKISEIK